MQLRRQTGRREAPGPNCKAMTCKGMSRHLQSAVRILLDVTSPCCTRAWQMPRCAWCCTSCCSSPAHLWPMASAVKLDTAKLLWLQKQYPTSPVMSYPEVTCQSVHALESMPCCCVRKLQVSIMNASWRSRAGCHVLQAQQSAEWTYQCCWYEEVSYLRNQIAGLQSSRGGPAATQHMQQCAERLKTVCLQGLAFYKVLMYQAQRRYGLLPAALQEPLEGDARARADKELAEQTAALPAPQPQDCSSFARHCLVKMGDLTRCAAARLPSVQVFSADIQCSVLRRLSESCCHLSWAKSLPKVRLVAKWNAWGTGREGSTSFALPVHACTCSHITLANPTVGLAGTWLRTVRAPADMRAAPHGTSQSGTTAKPTCLIVQMASRTTNSQSWRSSAEPTAMASASARACASASHARPCRHCRQRARTGFAALGSTATRCCSSCRHHAWRAWFRRLCALTAPAHIVSVPCERLFVPCCICQLALCVTCIVGCKQAHFEHCQRL